ncbi:MAG: hypothetical protein ACLRH0_06920 [Blautia wexlerae]
MVKHLRNADKIPDAWPEDLKDIPVPTDVEIIGYLYDEERRLKEFLKTEKRRSWLTAHDNPETAADCWRIENY